ncbi:TetR/AcrR family transcriptional regulator [Lichenifustis flavocetrariae]|uniref:TetR/AcrR family transcriptional regulator n=1 Tax=Lichenifustis flavocetrariae TaxID=2949735 RepID=A0AA41Z287_9HYPH|nr:TetR/AcrR family transcriptional regulator [Lichenifustis flavocetrariae]MCW6512884.1 TetR/AcrR family transcriptional regulator [Lichenifustis flavocetrariae]
MTEGLDTKPKRHTGGRPSQEEALRRDERLVEIAARMFMERGFDATTIDAVAEAASVGKATVYARYKDKAELFAAVLKRQVDRWLAVNDASMPAEGTIEEVLLALARRKIAIALTPEAVAINRIVSAQAGRFPELAKLVYKEGSQRSTAQIAELLRGFVHTGEIVTTDLEITAELFSSLIIGRQIRLALLGIDIDPEPLDQRLRAAVQLFLNGARPRST